MATGKDLLAGIQPYYPYLDPTSTRLNAFLDDQAAKGATVADILPGLSTNPEIVDAARQNAIKRLSPSRDLELNALDLNNQALDSQTTDINRQFDKIGEELARSAQSFQERQNQLGLLQSGQTSAGLQDILVKQKGETEQDRANKLAQIALQRAGINIKRADVGQRFSASVEDAVNQLLSGSTQAQQQQFDQELKLLQIAQELPYGQTFTIGGRKVIGMKRASGGSGSGNDTSSIASLLLAALQGKQTGGSQNDLQALLNQFEGLTGTPAPVVNGNSIPLGRIDISNLQGSAPAIQGGSVNLQANNGNPLQGTAPNLQGGVNPFNVGGTINVPNQPKNYIVPLGTLGAIQGIKIR